MICVVAYESSEEKSQGSARRLILQPQGGFIKKCIQLWETIMVRHGLMLVGQTVSGKTEVENVLAAALAAVADGENYLPVGSLGRSRRSRNGPIRVIFGLEVEGTQGFRARCRGADPQDQPQAPRLTIRKTSAY